MSEDKRENHVQGVTVEQIKKKDYKLLVDPQIRKGEEKLLRYEGTAYNTENHGQGVVVLRDPRPRMNRLWSRRERCELPVPRYKVDEWYIGAVPPREVTFSRLNDNITKQFMEKMCIKFGKLERVRVYHHPKTQKHMGLSKVVFSSIKSASECVKKLHETSIMGNVIHAQIDCKGETLNKLFQRIVRGEMMAETIPDVIRHTQDGISMSNKYKEHHHHHEKKERRKSSQDDPRKLRKSTEGKSKPNPHRPSEDKDGLKKNSEQHKDREEHNAQRNSHQPTHERLEKKPSVKTPVERKESGEHTDFETEHTSDCEEAAKSAGHRVWSSDLESRISSLLSEQTKKYKLDEVPLKNDEASNSKDEDQTHSPKRKERKSLKKAKRSKKRSVDSKDSNNAGDSPRHTPGDRLDVPNRKQSKLAKIRKRSRSESPMPDSYMRHSPPRDFGSPPRDFEQGSSTNRDLLFPHNDNELMPRDRHDSRSRSPGRNPAFFDPPPPHRFYDERDRFTPPLFHNRRPHSPRHSPRYGRDHRIPDRDRFDRDRDFDRFEMFRGEDRDFHRHNDLPYRRRDMSPPPRGMLSPRRHRGHSPQRWLPPDRFSDHVHPHHRRHSPPPPRDFFPISSRERSPRHFRRTPSPERRRFHTPDEIRSRREPIHDRRRRSRTPSPKRRQRTRSGEGERLSSRRKSSDNNSPKLSLDQRLKQMTGENEKSDLKRNNLNKVKDGDNESKTPDDDPNAEHDSVDMEISEGESEGEKNAREMQAQEPEQNNFQPQPQGHIPNQEQWNFNSKDLTWNGFGPRIDLPQQIDTRMWNPMQQNFFKDFQRDSRFPHPFPHGSQFPQDRWPGDAFHPAMRHAGVPHPYNIPPNAPQSHLGPHDDRPVISNDEIQKRFEDHQLSKRVLDNVVQDLKAIVSRDLNRKVIETMAYKVYEAWWDEKADTITKKPAIPKVQSSNTLVNKSTPNENNVANNDAQHESKPAGSNAGNRSLLNTFDPLNWAKNSFEMDGFRIGLGLRSAISKMPSFRVKKRPRTPTPPRENQEDVEITESKKARKMQDKENQGRKSKDKKYNRIALDSEGEDEEEEEENQSEEDESVDSSSEIGAGRKEKHSVLDVDEIFSDSSESSEESESENESEKAADSSDAESESENETMPEKKKDEQKSKLPIPDIDIEAVHEDNKEREKVQESGEDEEKSEKMDIDENSRPSSIVDEKPPLPKPIEKLQLPSEDPNLAASLLSPTAHGISPNSAITPQQLRHVHPKKRHRLLSQEAFSKVPDNKLRSEDEMLSTSNKNKTLTDTQLTPDRLLSTYSDSSPAPATPPAEPKTPTTPQKLSPITKNNDDEQNEQSPQRDLEAVAATLLSIGKTLPPLSPTTDTTSPALVSKNRKSKLPSTTNEEKARTVDLAEEHNYFVPSYGPPSPHPTLDPLVSQILEEHCYSRPVAELLSSDVDRKKGISSSLSPSTLSASSIYNFEDESLEIISAAERVKLRHIQPKDKKKRTTKEKKSSQRPAVQFPPRSEVDEMMILYEMWYNGLDLEDMKYLRTVYEGYLEKSNSPAWVNDSHWVAHPVTNIPSVSASKRRKSKRKSRSDKNTVEEDEEWHKTGCARTEGYYKLKDMIKLRQRQEMYGEGDSRAPAKSTKQASSSKATELTSGAQSSLDKNPGSRETRHFMRRIASEVGADVGDLFKYNQLMFRKKAVKFKRSSIHGWGLFAQEPIGADEMVIEYVGQVVRTLVAERREVSYTEVGIGSSYLFRIDSDHIIDATKCGNYARFMNHSCNPSCYAKVITVDTAKKIVIYSKGPIKKSQEITYDYKFPLEDDKIMCFCGAENCRRTLN